MQINCTGNHERIRLRQTYASVVSQVYTPSRKPKRESGFVFLLPNSTSSSLIVHQRAVTTSAFLQERGAEKAEN
jgi:hypothetical protein